MIGKVLLFTMNRTDIPTARKVMSFGLLLSPSKKFLSPFAKAHFSEPISPKMCTKNVSGEWSQALLHKRSRGVSIREFCLEESHFRFAGRCREFYVCHLLYVITTNNGDNVHYDGSLSTQGTCPTQLV